MVLWLYLLFSFTIDGLVCIALNFCKSLRACVIAATIKSNKETYKYLIYLCSPTSPEAFPVNEVEERNCYVFVCNIPRYSSKTVVNGKLYVSIQADLSWNLASVYMRLIPSHPHPSLQYIGRRSLSKQDMTESCIVIPEVDTVFSQN